MPKKVNKAEYATTYMQPNETSVETCGEKVPAALNATQDESASLVVSASPRHLFPKCPAVALGNGR